jgi:hypothetical protein
MASSARFCRRRSSIEWRRVHAQKRGGHANFISLDDTSAEQQNAQAQSPGLSPEKFFEQQWAATLLEVVLRRLREEFIAAGTGPLFEELKVFLTGENWGVLCGTGSETADDGGGFENGRQPDAPALQRIVAGGDCQHCFPGGRGGRGTASFVYRLERLKLSALATQRFNDLTICRLPLLLL